MKSFTWYLKQSFWILRHWTYLRWTDMSNVFKRMSKHPKVTKKEENYVTQNQVAYLQAMIANRQAKEQERHNKAVEQETARANLVTEGESKRHNVATETVSSGNLQELMRSNLVKEGQQSQTIAETHRTNVTKEALESKSISETIRSNKARETETNRSNLAKEAETYRSNVTKENEAYRHNVAEEGETQRYHIATQLETDRKLDNEIRQEDERLRQSAERNVYDYQRLVNETAEVNLKLGRKELDAALDILDTVFRGANVVSNSPANRQTVIDSSKENNATGNNIVGPNNAGQKGGNNELRKRSKGE